MSFEISLFVYDYVGTPKQSIHILTERTTAWLRIMILKKQYDNKNSYPLSILTNKLLLIALTKYCSVSL